MCGLFARAVCWVVFVPFICLFGAIAVAKGYGVDRESGLRAMAAGMVTLIVQVILWWLLYAVPKWGVVN